LPASSVASSGHFRETTMAPLVVGSSLRVRSGGMPGYLPTYLSGFGDLIAAFRQLRKEMVVVVIGLLLISRRELVVLLRLTAS
jgi:hypothetical protein